MIWPLQETLDLVEPHIPEILVPDAVFARGRDYANWLPPITSAYYIETRLGDASPQVDFSACIRSVSSTREGLPQAELNDFLTREMKINAHWRQIGTFVRQWTDAAPSQYHNIPLVWLEFDGIDKVRPQSSLPGMVVCIDPTHVDWRSTEAGATMLDSTIVQPFVESALCDLLGNDSFAAVEQKVRRCFQSLPDRGKILYVSVMYSRRPIAVKISGAIPKEQFPTYLERLAWPGSISEVKEILSTYANAEHEIRFDLAIAGTSTPRIGIELFSNVQINASDQRERDRLLDLFVLHGLCSGEERDVIDGWNGFSREQ